MFKGIIISGNTVGFLAKYARLKQKPKHVNNASSANNIVGTLSDTSGVSIIIFHLADSVPRKHETLSHVRLLLLACFYGLHLTQHIGFSPPS